MRRTMMLAGLALASLSATAGAPFLMLDTHLDTPIHFGRQGWDIMARHDFMGDLSQVDYPRMEAGGLDGGFFVVYTPQGPLTATGFQEARDWALMRSLHIHEMVSAHAYKFALALRADDALKIQAAGKKIVFQSIENSYPLGEDLSLLQTFYDLGVRMAGPVHFKVNQFADSATDAPRWKGLSPLGRKWVAEMNRLGMVIDASHASDTVFDQLLAFSKTPIILSHSGCKAIFDHPRNLDDARIKRLADHGGVIQINSVYLAPRISEPSLDAIEDRLEVIDQLSSDQQAQLIADHRDLVARLKPAPRANFDRFMDNLKHAIAIAGIDHVGIGADWDGGGGVEGMEDVADLPKVAAALRQAGYGDGDIAKIWSGNLLRVLRAAENYSEGNAAR